MAHRLFADANLGDPGHVPGAARLEREYLQILGRLAAGKGVGQVTSGASEANILALAWMRVRSGAKEIIVPRTGHFSFEKAAKFLGLRLRIAEIDKDHRVEPESVRGLMGPQTAGVVAVPHPRPERLQERLAAKGWRVNVLTRLRAIRIVLMPHVRRSVLRCFVPDLVDSYQRTAGVSRLAYAHAH